MILEILQVPTATVAQQASRWNQGSTTTLPCSATRLRTHITQIKPLKRWPLRARPPKEPGGCRLYCGVCTRTTAAKIDKQPKYGCFQKQGTQNRHQYIMILIIRTPKEGPLIFGTPYIPTERSPRLGHKDALSLRSYPFGQYCGGDFLWSQRPSC